MFTWVDTALEEKIGQLCEACYSKMDDDFNTAETLVVLFELSSIINNIHNKALIATLSKDIVDLLQSTYTGFLQDVFGLADEAPVQLDKLDQVMSLVLEWRNKAKKEKNYALSDEIRDQLGKIGIRIKDERSGASSWEI